MKFLCWGLVPACHAVLHASLSKDLTWSLRNKNSSVRAENVSVLNTHLALMEAGVLQGDPFYRDNELQWAWVGRDDWTYSTTFKSTEDMLSRTANTLRCQIDTVASIKINGKVVGKTDSMFRVYDFDVTEALAPAGSDNHVEVTIQSALRYTKEEAAKYAYPVPESVYYHDWSEGEQPDDAGWGNGSSSHRNFVRKISSDFGWDWGPSFVPSGITSFELLSRHAASLDDVTVQQRHEGDAVHLTVTASIGVVASSNVTLRAALTHKETGDKVHAEALSTAQLSSGQQDVTLQLRVEEPRLWWPVGYGNASLYNLHLELEVHGERAELTRRVGLRTVDLITEPLPNGESFYFRVNGEAVYAKGSNFIPADVFQPRQQREHRWILESAREANMNMVRVWGGGLYQDDSFYDVADELGLMIWQEVMFACALYPRNQGFLESVRIEVTQQVQRLQHHASIVIWGGNNENEKALTWYDESKANRDLYVVDYTALYVETVRAALLSLDQDVAFIDSSPSNGVISTMPYTKRWGSAADPNYGDMHYYNYQEDCEDHTTYPKSRFISEHGVQSFPSFEEYRHVLSETDWSWNSSQLSLRQRHPGGQAQMLAMLQRHFRVPPEFDTSKQQKVFDDYLYLTQVQQSRCYETALSQWRRLRSDPETQTMGILYWQLNDIWQGPSWSSLEHSGRWKLTHSAVQRVFEPVMLSMVQEQGRVRTFLTSDLPRNISAKVTITLRGFEGSVKWSSACKVSALAGTAECMSFDVKQALEQAGCSKESCFVMAQGTTEYKRLEAHLFLTPLKNVKLPQVKESISNMTVLGKKASFTVSVDNIAVYATLESPVPGRFVPNAMHLLPGKTTSVEFVARDGIDAASFAKTLRFRSLQDSQPEVEVDLLV